MKRKTVKNLITMTMMSALLLGGSTLAYAAELPEETQTEAAPEEAAVLETEIPDDTVETEETELPVEPETEIPVEDVQAAEDTMDVNASEEQSAVTVEQAEPETETDDEELSGFIDANDPNKVSNKGVYIASQDSNGVLAGVDTSGYAYGELEYQWLLYDKNSGSWTMLSDWSVDGQWISFKPKYGEYTLRGSSRKVVEVGARSTTAIDTDLSYHPNIKGKCQMPYTGEGGGYLIGVESYDNPNNAYSYELLVLDCTKLAAGDPAPWIYSSGQQKVSGNAFWTVWQPQYGYYWTLFRVYDADGNLIDEDCYGFENTDGQAPAQQQPKSKAEQVGIGTIYKDFDEFFDKTYDGRYDQMTDGSGNPITEGNKRNLWFDEYVAEW